MTKKKKKQIANHHMQLNESTAFTKVDWYGAGRKGRKRKKSKNKIKVYNPDNKIRQEAELGIILETGEIVVKRDE